MGQNGSSLSGTASINSRLLPFTQWGTAEIIAMKTRHRHDLGSRFALGPRQFSALLGGDEAEALEIFKKVLDTDANSLVDALESLAVITLISSMPLREKLDHIFGLYDFTGSGEITLDEMTIMLRTVAAGAGKLDKAIQVPSMRQLEELTQWAFKKADKDADGEIAKYEFDAFCLSNPTVANFLNFWSASSNQVVIPEDMEHWTDSRFLPVGESLYSNVLSPPVGALPAHAVSWLRPSKLCPGEPKMCKDGATGVHIGDMRHGHLANAWFLDALALVSKFPSVLRRLFVATGQEEKGRYAIRFFKEERWQTVDIDDHVPCDPLGRPLFAHAVDPNELWPALIEKAYAKMHGSYEALVQGQCQYALRDLTGGTVEVMDLHSKRWEAEIAANRLWAQLQDVIPNDSLEPGESVLPEYMVGCKWRAPSLDAAAQGGTLQGIQFNTMHAVLRCVSFKQTHLLQLQNPWGGSSFDGDWSPDSPLWETAPPDLLALIGGRGDGEGTGRFWMNYDDFISIFDTVYVCKLHDEKRRWTHHLRKVSFPQESGGSPQEGGWVANPQYFFQVAEKSDVEVSLTQPDDRFHGKHACFPGLASLSLYIQKFNWGPDTTAVRTLDHLVQTHMQTMSNAFVNSRTVTVKATLEPGKYVIVPMTYTSGTSLNGWLSVFSQSPLYPTKLYSEEEIELEDPTHTVEDGVAELEVEPREERSDNAPDLEQSNEVVSLAALSELVSKMWMVAKQLDVRRQDLAVKIDHIEKRRKSRTEEGAVKGQGA